MTRKAIPLDALRCCRGVFWQNPFLRPDIPVSTGLITAKSLSTPRYPGIDGAYYGKILIYAPISRYRRGLLRQNPYLRPAGPRSPGLILTESLAAPRWSEIPGVYPGKISCCAPLVRDPRGLSWQNLLLRPAGPRSPGLILTESLSAPRWSEIPGAYSDKISF